MYGQQVLNITGLHHFWTGTSMDPKHLLCSATCNIICSVMFGSRYEHEDEHFQAMVNMMEENSKITNGPWMMVVPTHCIHHTVFT